MADRPPAETDSIEVRVERARAAVRKVLAGTNWLSKEGSRQSLRPIFETLSDDDLIAAALSGQLDVLDVLRDRLRKARAAREPVSELFIAFLGEYFLDELPKRSSSWYFGRRDAMIFHLVNHIHEQFGLPIQRSPALRDKETLPMSACGIVALETNMGESTIEGIRRDQGRFARGAPAKSE